MKPVLLETALGDIERGFAFYEQQQPGLGQDFEDAILADIAELERHAGIHRIVAGCHRMLATRFSFAIYYRVEVDQARVRAILDCRRDPLWVERRLT